jgi:hypothetical protein
MDLPNPCAQDVKPGESGLPTSQPSLGPAPADSLTLLISALHDQTAAINRLAGSNEALAQAVATLIEEMAQADDSDPDAAPTTYMDGSRVG